MEYKSFTGMSEILNTRRGKDYLHKIRVRVRVKTSENAEVDERVQFTVLNKY